MARALHLIISMSRKASQSTAKNVLIVDDNGDLRRILALFLQSRGYETSEAATGHEAIEIAIVEKPDIILLDLNLPDMKGTDAARKIRKYPSTAHIPIVGCSAYSEVELVQEALRAGITDYAQKPFSATAIATIIEQLILSKR
jgi:CheY-like chemotaxis protein